MAETTPAPDLEFQALVRKKYAGNPAALTALGARLLVGRDAPRSLVDGKALITEAAQQGDADAWCLLALLAAAGVDSARDWDAAYAALQRAVALGSTHAARQTQVLQHCGIGGAAAARQWLAATHHRVLRESPRLVTIAGFLPPAVCDYLMQRSAERLVKAQVHDAYGGGLKTDPMRTNQGAAYSLIDSDVVMQLVRARIAHAAGVAFDTLEPTEMLHYAAGEHYKPHFDFFHPALPHYADEMRIRGQRIRTCLVYINGGYQGGETAFPKIGIQFRGQPGEALIFDNVLADGSGDPLTLHAGLPPTAGEKWLLSQWIRERTQPLM